MLQTIDETSARLHKAYEKTNDSGHEEIAKYAEMIAKIPEYQKSTTATPETPSSSPDDSAQN